MLYRIILLSPSIIGLNWFLKLMMKDRTCNYIGWTFRGHMLGSSHNFQMTFQPQDVRMWKFTAVQGGKISMNLIISYYRCWVFLLKVSCFLLWWGIILGGCEILMKEWFRSENIRSPCKDTGSVWTSLNNYYDVIMCKVNYESCSTIFESFFNEQCLTRWMEKVRHIVYS